jgi:hypothetical protein
LELNQLEDFLAALERFIGSGMTTTEILPKNKSNEIRIYSASFAERQLVHIRTFYRNTADGAGKPSPKGIAVDPSLLERIIEAVERARLEAEKLIQ